MTRVLVVGEAIVDVVEGVPLPGGSPLNVAVGVARLGVPALLHTHLGDYAEGELLASHVAASGVELTAGSVIPGPSSVAAVQIGADGAAEYDFRVVWDPAPIPAVDVDLVHLGSIGALLEPGATRMEEQLAVRGGLLSFDPNIRAALLGEHAEVRARVERLVAMSALVKASDEDLAWLYPGSDPEEVARTWAGGGERLVVVTRGPEGAFGIQRGTRVDVPSGADGVVDTVGAGDSFMAGLIVAALELGLGEAGPLLEFAARCSAITVGRAGANPPWRAELG